MRNKKLHSGKIYSGHILRNLYNAYSVSHYILKNIYKAYIIRIIKKRKTGMTNVLSKLNNRPLISKRTNMHKKGTDQK
jgi:hypothetical protein